MRASDFDFALPPDLIAQAPAARRDQSRLLALDRATGRIEHRRFADLAEYFSAGDLLVLNDSRVIPARLRARNTLTTGHFELLLLEEIAENDWWAMMRPGRRAKPGTKIQILGKAGKPSGFEAAVREFNALGHRRLQFSGPKNILTELDALGETPLPPYIERTRERPEDRERYQTVYARAPGSVAAPTAGLHFTPACWNKFAPAARGSVLSPCTSAWELSRPSRRSAWRTTSCTRNASYSRPKPWRRSARPNLRAAAS